MRRAFSLRLTPQNEYLRRAAMVQTQGLSGRPKWLSRREERL